MLRLAFCAFRQVRPLALQYINATRIANTTKAFSSLSRLPATPQIQNGLSLTQNKQILDIASNLSPVPVRTVTKFSMKKGKRKTVKAVIRRFYRLDWGGWIRPKVGRQKKMWKKTSSQKRRLKQHVFCNATQSTLLDKMVTKFWRRPKYFVNDPYTPYKTREEFWITRKTPQVRN